MSRIGKLPIPIPDGVKINVTGRTVAIESSKGKLAFTHREHVGVRVDTAAKQIIIERKSNDRQSRALHGTTRALIANMIEGVTKGFLKELDLIGVGWTVAVQGPKVVLNVGFANTLTVPIPQGVQVDVQQTRIKVSGLDKHAVGQLASIIRSKRPPEPYNGKGIKYIDEVIIRKSGKAFAGGSAA